MKRSSTPAPALALPAALLFAITLLCAARPAQAQLDLTFNPSSASLFLGDTLVFDAILTNTSLSDTISLVGFGSNLSGPNTAATVAWDVDPFESALPLELAPGETYSRTMTMSVLSGGTPGVYVATYSIDGDGPTASADLTMSVRPVATAVVPEGSSMAFLALGGSAFAAATGLRVWRRRQSRVPLRFRFTG